MFLIQGGLLGFVGSLIGSGARRAGADRSGTHSARQVDGSELFPLILEPSLFVVAAVLATLTGVAAAIAPGAARGAARSGGGDPWLTSCASRQIRKSYNVGTPVETEVLHGIDLAHAVAASSWR